MSTAKFDTWQDSSGTNEFYKCRAWVNFNGTGTVAIRESGNVDSITDNGTGDYTISFTSALPDANYSQSVSISPDYGTSDAAVCLNTQSGGLTEVAPTASLFRVLFTQSGGATRVDTKYTAIAVFR